VNRRWLFAMMLPSLVANIATAQTPAPLPSRLSDAQFWQFISDVSEPGGYFRSDNFLSNETSFQHVIPDLQQRFVAGGVYLGVGPEQNFTYIAAIKPKIAIVFDIRRQNMIEHLLYKAIFEQSSDRAEFLARLFSRARPSGLDTATSAVALFTAYAAIPPDSAFYRRNTRAVFHSLVDSHGFRLTSEDSAALTYVYDAFFMAGPELNYSFSPARPQFMRGRMPTYAELMTENDGHDVPRSYLATEANYRWLRDLEARNLLIPLVGDFAGPKAIRAVGTYLRAHNATVSAFYTSNVEQYLFRQGDDWSKYYENVATLPLDSSSVFIRAVFNGGRGFGVTVAPSAQPPTPNSGFGGYFGGMRSETTLSSILETIKAMRDGRLTSYADAVQIPR
jgi:hypothetical protein